MTSFVRILAVVALTGIFVASAHAAPVVGSGTLLLDLRAFVGTQTTGGDVDVWEDQSGMGLDFNAVGGTGKPTLQNISNAYKGVGATTYTGPALFFDATGGGGVSADALQRPAAQMGPLNFNDESFTISAAFVPDQAGTTYAADGTLIYANWDGATRQIDFGPRNPSGSNPNRLKFEVGAGDAGGNSGGSGETVMADAEVHIITGVYDNDGGPSYARWVDGASDGTSVGGKTVGTSSLAGTIGQRSNLANGAFRGHIIALAMYSGALNNTDRAAVEASLLVIPEPSSALLAMFGIVGLLGVASRRRRSRA